MSTHFSITIRPLEAIIGSPPGLHGSPSSPSPHSPALDDILLLTVTLMEGASDVLEVLMKPGLGLATVPLDLLGLMALAWGGGGGGGTRSTNP